MMISTSEIAAKTIFILSVLLSIVHTPLQQALTPATIYVEDSQINQDRRGYDKQQDDQHDNEGHLAAIAYSQGYQRYKQQVTKEETDELGDSD